MERHVLWQEVVGDLNSPYVAVSEDGIEISNGRSVFVKSADDWFKLAIDAEISKDMACQTLSHYEPSKLDKTERYLHMLYEALKVEHNVHTEIDEALKQFKAEAGI